MNRWALVTGASKGIGKELAIALVERGWNVVLVARSKVLLEELAAVFNTSEERARLVVCDLCVSEQRDKLVAIRIYRHFFKTWSVIVRAL